MPHALQFLVLVMSGWLTRRQQSAIEYLRAENRVLREQLGGRRLRLTDDQRRRLAVLGRALGRKALREVACIVTPDTILRWHRELIAKKYDGSARRKPGRSRTRQELADLVIRMANENSTWGYTRIRGALANLGHEIGRNTIKRILMEHGIEPAPERGRRMPWSAFLRAHWETLAAADFFTVEVLNLSGLTRYFVLFVMELKTRRVEVAGITSQPHGAWMEQIGRNLTDAVDGLLKDARYLIRDRDPLYTKKFCAILAGAGVKTLKLPPKSPDLNAHAERFVRSIKAECINRVVPLGERHLRTVVREYMIHYHEERNHQSLDNQLIRPAAGVVRLDKPIKRRERLGGLLNYYHREAA